MGAFDEPATYHSGENNSTTGREPFEDTSRDFIHSGNTTHAPGTGIPGTFGAGVGGASAGGLTGSHTHGQSHGLNRRGSASSSSSSSEEEVDGVRRKKLNRTKKNKKPIGEKVKEAVGLGGAGAGVAGTHGKHQTSEGSHIQTGSGLGASHGVSNLHGERDAYNEGVPTRGDIRTGTSADPAVSHASGLGGIAGTRQTGDAPGGIQSGNTHYGTGHNLAAEARDHTTGSHHTGTGLTSQLPGAGGIHTSSGQYGSNTAASNYASTTEHSSGLGHSSDLGHTSHGEDRSAAFDRNQGGPGNQGISGGGLSGAAGTDRFDVDRSSSGVTGGVHGQDSGVSRHGPTGSFANNATSTGGAYDNPDAKTGLTGREHTQTGVPDKDGNATHTGEAHSGGLMEKVKGILGGHSK